MRYSEKSYKEPKQLFNSNANLKPNSYTDVNLTGYNIDDIDAVAVAVSNLLSIMIGEVMFNRALGSNLRNYLFRQCTYTNSVSILSDSIATLGRFEPRVKVHNSSRVDMYPDQRKYELFLNLQVEGVQRLIPLRKTLDLITNNENY